MVTRRGLGTGLAAAAAPGPVAPVIEPIPSADDLAARYLGRIHRMALRLTRDRDEADDLTQDVLVRVLDNLHRYEPGSFDGWLYRITRNLFLDRIRRHRRVRFDDLPDGDWEQPVEPAPGPDVRAEGTILREQLERALEELPAHLREVVVLRDLHDLTYERIAAIIARPVGTVRSRLHRGRRQLRAVLERHRAASAADA